MKRLVSLLAALALVPALALAQQQFSYGEVKPPQPVDADGKIEVLEFFWYGCIHCYNLEPAIEKWEKNRPADVRFRRVPVVFDGRTQRDAPFYYAFEALGLVDKLHRPFFDAIHKDGLRLENANAVTEWLQRNGVDPKKFNETVKSFGVQSKLRRAQQMTVAYRIEGTPTMAVQGRYTVAAENARSPESMLKTVDHLVETVRKNK
jgi:protein dithiol oxidoreductase (disulfide-forming)